MTSNSLSRGSDYDVHVVYTKTAGQSPAAISEQFEIICVTHGTVEYWIEDKYYRAGGGDILLVPAGAMVSTSFKQRGCPCGRYRIWFSAAFLQALLALDADAGFAFMQALANGSYMLRLPVQRFEELYTVIEAIVSETSMEGRLNTSIATKAMLTSLLVQVNRLVSELGHEIMPPCDRSRLAPVLAFIHENCTGQITVEKVAEQFGYSASHLAHSFKKHLGTSLYHYVLLRRLQIGRQAMLQGVPVKEAYMRCGFGDYAGFYRAFTKEYGLSPQQYKKQASGK